MSRLFQSRKFLILLLDAVFGLAALLVAFLLAESNELRVLIFGVFAILQPVFYGVIDGIAKEDVAALSVGVHPTQTGRIS